MSSVAGMHQETFSLDSAWVATYEGEATVWVGEAGSDANAQQLLQAMYEAIGRGGTPFSPPFVTQVGATPLFTTTDGRQQHYFYASGERVIWIAAPAAGGTVFVQEATAALR